MGWNPFDRRTDDQRAIDDALLGLGKPPWVEHRAGQPTLFVREAVGAWRTSRASSRFVEDPNARRLDKVRKIVDRDRDVENRSVTEIADLDRLRSTIRGNVVFAVAFLATTVSQLDAWTSDDVAHRIVRIDLASEVTSVARSAALLESAFERLGKPPTGHLADDEEVQLIYKQRTAALADRQRTLVARLTALRSYLDGLMDIEKELQKVRWIEHHGSPDLAEFETLEGDELAFNQLNAARDMFAETTDRIGIRLRDAAERLGRPA